MTNGLRHLRHKGLVAVLSLIGALPLAACGDDDKSSDNGGNGGGGDGDGDGDSNNGGSTGGGNNGGTTCNESACMECVFGGGDLTACLAPCEGCDEEGGGGGGDGDGDTGGGGGGNVPDKECRRDSECGLSYECVSCGLNDNEGWCEQTKSCSFDEDCKIGYKCGYRVESQGYRCLPADYCE